MKFLIIAMICGFFIFLPMSLIGEEKQIKSYSEAKEALMQHIYRDASDRRTLYCQAIFDEDGKITLPPGFIATKHTARANRLEWEHVVPVENFGRTFTEWRDGHPLCVDSSGEPYKGRRCAEKISPEFRQMSADMHNLYPAIGAVNAARSNYNFAPMPEAKSDFGLCPMKIENRRASPPEASRGQIARAYLYMESTYARYRMNNSQRKLMKVWDKQHPPTADECRRVRRIAAITGNENLFVITKCKE